jgi:hypothetical protein
MTRREAAKRQREKATVDRKAGRPAAEQLLKRDLGPAKALVRDIVDSRRNVSIILLPVVVVYLLAFLGRNSGFQSFIGPLYVAGLVVIVFDLFNLSRLISNRMKVELPGEPVKGLRFYGLMRATQFRRMRTPKPTIGPPPIRLPFRR